MQPRSANCLPFVAFMETLSGEGLDLTRDEQCRERYLVVIGWLLKYERYRRNHQPSGSPRVKAWAADQDEATPYLSMLTILEEGRAELQAVCVRSFVQVPAAWIHSPAEITASWPMTVMTPTSLGGPLITSRANLGRRIRGEQRYDADGPRGQGRAHRLSGLLRTALARDWPTSARAWTPHSHLCTLRHMAKAPLGPEPPACEDDKIS